MLAPALKATSYRHNDSGREGGRAGAGSPQRVQCARTSPCEHVRYMARRLALLVLLACAVAIHRPPLQRSSEASDSESMDPFILWDDSESYETTRPPRPRTTKTSAKVILRAKGPKVNVSVKKTKDEDKKNLIKSTTINIESHTNIVMTKRPPFMSMPKPNKVVQVPLQSVEDGDFYQDTWMEEPNLVSIAKPHPRKPSTTRRPPTSTRRRPSPATHRTTTHIARRTPKPTKTAPQRKISCPPKSTEWLSNYFQKNKVKKSPKKPEKSGWFTGR